MSCYPITLDKERNMRFGMRAISLVEKKLKKPLSKIDMSSLSMDEMAVLIWAGLQHEDKDLTPDKAMDLVDDYSNVKLIMNCVNDALNDAFGVEEEEQAEENTEEKNE